MLTGTVTCALVFDTDPARFPEPTVVGALGCSSNPSRASSLQPSRLTHIRDARPKRTLRLTIFFIVFGLFSIWFANYLSIQTLPSRPQLNCLGTFNQLMICVATSKFLGT